jgi:hypothetical protein
MAEAVSARSSSTLTSGASHASSFMVAVARLCMQMGLELARWRIICCCYAESTTLPQDAQQGQSLLGRAQWEFATEMGLRPPLWV